MIYGFDMSHWNAQKQFKKAMYDGNIDFIILKATEGATYVDGTFKPRATALAGSNKLAGAYHFFNPRASIQEQVNNFMNTVFDTFDAGKVLLAVDIEDTKGITYRGADIAKAFEFCQMVEEVSGTKPLYYINKDFEKRFDFSEFRKNDNGLWIADYSVKRSKLYQHTLTAIRQKNSLYFYDESYIDYNEAYMTKEGWAKYASSRYE